MFILLACPFVVWLSPSLPSLQRNDFFNPLCSPLQNLDALHDHLATIYPGMRAPSFRCTDADKGRGLILHYYSEREGLQDIVIGIIKTVAQQIHGTEIDMKVMDRDLNGRGTLGKVSEIKCCVYTFSCH